MSTSVRDVSGNGPGNHVPPVPVRSIDGTFTGTGNSSALVTSGRVNINIQKAGGSATIEIQKSFDKGSTYNIVSKNVDGDDASYASAVDFNGTVEEVGEAEVLYRLSCTTYGSGTTTYRLSRAT